MQEIQEILNILKKKYKKKNLRLKDNRTALILYKRLGLLKKYPLRDIKKKEIWNEINYLFFNYTNDICKPKEPNCDKCILIDYCEELGSKNSYHKNFKCNRCGYCCTCRVYITKKDIERIKEKGYKEDEFIQIVHNDKAIKIVNKGCFFLRKGKNNYYCEIYEHRPQICRIYPNYSKEIKECKEHSRLKILQQLP